MLPATLTDTLEPAAPKPLYPQLKPRRKGPSHEQVAANQRTRLCAAMVEAVAERGYEAATVPYVCALAGVSKRTVYQLFAGKLEWFLACYDQVVGDGVERISAAYRAEPSKLAVGAGAAVGERAWADGLCRAFDAFVAEIAARPHAARLALVEVLAAGPEALPRIERGEAVFERMIAQSLAQAPDGMALPPVLVKGVVHGIWYVARSRLLEGRPAAMTASGRELLDWMLTYRSPAVGTLAEGTLAAPALPVEVPSRPGAGAHAELGPDDERVRILHAAARIVAREGYAALTVAGVLDEGGVSYEAFFECFKSAEQCFLGCLDMLSAQALARALRDSEGAPDWPAAVCRTVSSLLDRVARDPVFARVAFVEVFAAGPAGVERRAALMGSFAQVLVRRATGARRPSPLVAEAIVGAVWGIAHHHVAHGRARLLPALSGHAAYVVLAPIVGPERAIEAILAERAAGERKAA